MHLLASLHNQIVALHLGVFTTLHWLHCKPHRDRIMQPFPPHTITLM